MQCCLPKSGTKAALAARLWDARHPAAAGAAGDSAASPGTAPAAEAGSPAQPAAAAQPAQSAVVVSRDADDDGVVRSGRRNSRRSRCLYRPLSQCLVLFFWGPSKGTRCTALGAWHAVCVQSPHSVSALWPPCRSQPIAQKVWSRAPDSQWPSRRRWLEAEDDGGEIGLPAAAAAPAVPPTGRSSVIAPEESVDDMEMVRRERIFQRLAGERQLRSCQSTSAAQVQD